MNGSVVVLKIRRDNTHKLVFRIFRTNFPPPPCLLPLTKPCLQVLDNQEEECQPSPATMSPSKPASPPHPTVLVFEPPAPPERNDASTSPFPFAILPIPKNPTPPPPAAAPSKPRLEHDQLLDGPIFCTALFDGTASERDLNDDDSDLLCKFTTALLALLT